MRAPGAADHLRGRGDGKPPEAVRDHRGADRQLHGVHALRRLAAEEARTARGFPAEPRDRAALPRRGHAPLPQGRGGRAAAVPATHQTAGRRARRRLPARRQPRSRLRALRGAGAGCDHGRRGDAGRRRPRDRADPGLRDGRRDPDADRGVRRPGRDDRAPSARAPDPAGPRRRRRAHRACDRAQRRPSLPDRPPRLHGVAAEEGRAERPRPTRAPEAPRLDARLVRHDAPRPGRGAGARRPLELDQHEAADAPRSCAERSSSSTSGPTRASTACGRSRT